MKDNVKYMFKEDEDKGHGRGGVGRSTVRAVEE